jgi:TRAP-type C4-dicarboxylate transport system permease small subunit
MMALLQSSVGTAGRILRRFEDLSLMLLLGAMILLAGLQIVQRNLLGTGWIWIDELLRILVLWLGLVGAVIATRGDRHITIDVLSRWLPIPVQQRLKVLVEMFAGVVCAILCWHGLRFVLMERSFGAAILGDYPAWLAQVIIPIAFGLMTGRYLWRLCRRLLPDGFQ